MKTIAVSFALITTALLATAASAAPLSVHRPAIANDDVQSVRLVCTEDGRCWRNRGNRRAVVRDSYNYAPRQRYYERREYYDRQPGAGVYFGAPGAGVGIGVNTGPRW